MSFPDLRADLVDLTGYHSPQPDVEVRLNTNESPYPPPPGYAEAVADAVARIDWHRYPDRSALALREETAEFLGQPAERVFCANGSNEVLQTLLLAYGGGGRSAAVFRPSYLLHEHISRITGTEVITGDRRADFTLDAAAASEMLTAHRPEITFVCSPNNPTGLVEPPDVVRSLLAAVPGLLVVDEAYAEFAPWSALELVEDDEPLVVVRTFSKVWSLAAVRLGCCVAPPRVIADLERLVLPYHLSTFTQEAGRVALRFRDEMQRRVEAIVDERDRLISSLEGFSDLAVFRSGANFVLFRPPGDGRQVWQGLVDRGVLVRDCSSWEGLGGCLRVTIGTPAENEAFLTALKEVVG